MEVGLSIFSRLRRLFSSVGFPLEDYLTELVAGVIERHPAEFVEWLRRIGATTFDSSAEVGVRTQYYCPANTAGNNPELIIDFFIRLKQGKVEEILFIESKVGAGLSGDDQLRKYARFLSFLPASRRTFLFITRDYLPQDAEVILADVPPKHVRPLFIQKRWSDFAGFVFRRDSKALADPIGVELFRFMKTERLTQGHQFTPHDIAAIAGFSHALSLLRAALDDSCREKLKAVCGDLQDQYDADTRIIREESFFVSTRSKTHNIGAQIGFYLPGGDDGYPTVYTQIDFESRTTGKPEICAAMHDFVAQKQGRWKLDNVSPTSEWGRIFQDVSLSTFLGSENHVNAVKTRFHEFIDEIAEFKKKYPALVWET